MENTPFKSMVFTEIVDSMLIRNLHRSLIDKVWKEKNVRQICWKPKCVLIELACFKAKYKFYKNC